MQSIAALQFDVIPAKLQDVILEDVKNGGFRSSFFGHGWLYYNNKTEAHAEELRIHPFLKKDIEVLAIMQFEPDWNKATEIYASLAADGVDVIKEYDNNTLLYLIKGPTVTGIRTLLQAAIRKIDKPDLKKELVQACAELEEFENMVVATKLRDWAKQNHPKLLKGLTRKKPKKAKPSSYDFMDLKSIVDDFEVERELNNLKNYIPA